MLRRIADQIAGRLRLRRLKTMKLALNSQNEVELLRQTLHADAHLEVRLPNNPYKVYKCLRQSRDDDDEDAEGCLADLIDVVDASVDVGLE